MMSHPLQELHRGWLNPLQCCTDAVQSRNLEEGDCTKRALTVEHMATNICKNVSPVNRLAAKSSCNWWLRGRGHNHLRINRCHPLALTSFCFFFYCLFSSFPFLFEHILTEYILRTQSWTTGEHSHDTILCHQNTKIHILQFLRVPQLTIRVRAKWMFSLSLNCWRSCSTVVHHWN